MEDLVKSSKIDHHFWKGKRVLVTGHSGFKGGWLSIWLHRMGAKVFGVSLPPAIDPNLFKQAQVEDFCAHSFMCDICDFDGVASLVRDIDPEVVFHLAAQSLVRTSYIEPLSTFNTNVLGSLNLLESLREVSSIKVVLMITTDKVYKELELPRPFVEDDILGGHDPYSASKACSETAINAYRDSFLRSQGIALATARSGNVIGGGDWAKDRLIPDAIRAWGSGDKLIIRNPEAIRPWQHVLEPLAGYLTLAQCLWSDPRLEGAYNFGPNKQNPSSVRHVVQIICDQLDDLAVTFSNPEEDMFESAYLSLDTEKARRLLAFSSEWNIHESIAKTLMWYERWSAGVDAASLCQNDISSYENGIRRTS